ncbi:hypothetical protein Ciccas_009233 [Cichlidogyrus casuarinus]|uniref:Uncharacterized protein n=1 Tax=Cichlidogyrus casuarinus TaxID=1844966 RepID=A0ABD2PXM8_9PLAT
MKLTSAVTDNWEVTKYKLIPKAIVDSVLLLQFEQVSEREQLITIAGGNWFPDRGFGGGIWLRNFLFIMVFN